jgi:hypothetical protein
MHCDVQKFQYSGEQESIIRVVEVEASIRGTTMTLIFPSGKKEDIVASLSKIKVPLQSVKLTSISIQTSFNKKDNIRESLEALSKDGLIHKEFAKEIISNYPNGYGGAMDLNNVFHRLVVVSPSFFNKHFQVENESQEAQQDALDSTTLCH